MADEYGTYRAIRRIYVGNALAFNIGDWVPVSHVDDGLVPLDAVELAPDVTPPPVDVFDERVADLIDGDTETRVRLGAASVARSGRSIFDDGVAPSTTTSLTAAIKAALDARPGEAFYFPPGNYRLNTKLSITGGNTLILAPGARLYAGAAMDTLVEYTTTDESFVRDAALIGGLLDGNLLADKVLTIENVLRFTLTQFTIRDGIHRAVKTGPEGAEVIAYNGRIYNTTATNVVDNIAIEDTMGDNHWSDIIILDWTQGVLDTAASSWFRIHPWLGQDGMAGAQIPARYPTSVAFESSTQSDFDACFSDTYRTPFKASSNGTDYTPSPRFINCRAFWAPTNLSAALANANPACVIDNTDGVGVTVDRLSSGGHPESPVDFLKGPATGLTVRNTINYGFTDDVADYRNGVKQGETTFTPTLKGSTVAGTPTYTSQTGRMFVQGDTVTYTFSISATLDSLISGNLRLGGFPSPAGSGGVRPGSGSINYVANVPASSFMVWTGDLSAIIPYRLISPNSAEVDAVALRGLAVELRGSVTLAVVPPA